MPVGPSHQCVSTGLNRGTSSSRLWAPSSKATANPNSRVIRSCTDVQPPYLRSRTPRSIAQISRRAGSVNESDLNVRNP